MPPFRILALVVITSLAAGCAVGPDTNARMLRWPSNTLARQR